jgi:hypothetical protein
MYELPRFEVTKSFRDTGTQSQYTIPATVPENFDMATGVSLPDEYVLLLQNVVEENRLLRKQMASSIASNETALKSIDDKVNIRLEQVLADDRE